MSLYDKFYNEMPDGTIKQINPFNNTEVWCVAERGRGPVIISPPEIGDPIDLSEPESYCHFCEAQHQNTTPEKARVYLDKSGKWKKDYHPTAEEVQNFTADFRRVGNLFEIVTYDYWRKNYGYEIPDSTRDWMDNYLRSTDGINHVLNILEIKLRRMGIDFDELTLDDKIERATPFFGGCHELIIAKRHYQKGAKFTHELCSSGCLSRDEHYQYTKFTIESIEDIRTENPYVRFVSVFQNWLKPAGASFDHLHRQMVGLDEWGVQSQREIEALRENPNLFNDFAANYAIYNSLMIAENDYALAFAEIGHRYPSIAVYSKSRNSRPFEHSKREIQGLSDLLHAMHIAITPYTSCNEEWYYSPFDSIYRSPWHILLKLRLHTPAGFEGNTKIYINPVSPKKLRDEMIQKLLITRDKGLISKKIRIGEELDLTPNPLKYYLGKNQ